jgi:hypothetical protein
VNASVGSGDDDGGDVGAVGEAVLPVWAVLPVAAAAAGEVDAAELRKLRLVCALPPQKSALHSPCSPARVPGTYVLRLLECPAYVGTALLEPT